LQGSGFLNIFEKKADLFLALVVFFALTRGFPSGELLGFGLGLVEDVFSGSLLGMHALCKVVASCVAELTKGMIYVQHTGSQIFVFSIVSLFNSLFTFLVYGVYRAFNFNFSLIWRVALPESFYNLLLAIPIFIFLNRFLKNGS
jgi:rod shape-determining protein MreD